jgi:hypothetical protein
VGGIAGLAEDLAQDQEDFQMSQELQEKPAPYNLLIMIDIKKLCGPPPILSCENVKAYDTMLFRLIESLKPGDVMEGLFVRHLADCEWEIIRYGRHKILLMERGHRQLLDTRAQRIKAAAQNKQAQARSESPADATHAALKEIEATTLQAPTQADYAEALEHGIDYAERLDALLNAAIARRDDVLLQRERYRDARSCFGFTPVTHYVPGASERRMREEFGAIAAEQKRLDDMCQQDEALPAAPNSEGKQVESPPASPNSGDKQVEPPPASSDT